MVDNDLSYGSQKSLASMLTLQEVVPPTPGALPGLSFRGHRYQLTSASFTWEEAQTQAIQLGGNLVTINDAAEQQWLAETFGTVETLWTGLTDQDREGSFTWVSGEAVTFTNWAEGQPQQDPFARAYAEREDYATFNFLRTPFWADTEGSARYRGIIEIPGDPSPQGTDLPPSDLSEIVVRGDVTKPQIFLTFDDGPVADQTSEILDILDQFDVKASFFLVGQQVEIFTREAQRMADGGHVLGNHSFSHDEFVDPITGEVQGLEGLSAAAVRDELVRTEQAIQSVTGQTPRYFRPPFNLFNDETHRASDELGLMFVSASEKTDTPDWKEETTVAELVDILLDNAENGSIFVLHDHGQATPDALRIAIPQLLERGFEFVTLDALKL